MTRYSYPDPPPVPTCAMLMVPVEIAPIVGALFSQMERRSAWESESDWRNGYQAFADLQVQLMNTCMEDLIAELRALRGLKPEFEIVYPEERTSEMYRSFNDVIQAVVDARGVLSDGWFTEPVFATLADVVRAMRGSDATKGKSIWDDIKDLISTGANVASIANFVAGVLEETEEAIVEGGLLIVLNALTAANTAILKEMSYTQSVQSIQILSIIQALRGATAPDDSIIEALRGTTVATATRNVVDLLE